MVEIEVEVGRAGRGDGDQASAARADRARRAVDVRAEGSRQLDHRGHRGRCQGRASVFLPIATEPVRGQGGGRA